MIFEKPDESDQGAVTRYNRRVLAYRALLAKAGFEVPKNLAPRTERLFNQELLKAMQQSTGKNPVQYQTAAQTLAAASASWPQLAVAFEHLYSFLMDDSSGYRALDDEYMKKHSGDNWADDDLRKLLEMFTRPNGSRQIGKVRTQHTSSTRSDYAEDIYRDLTAGRLVIIDQSSGEPEINRSSAERIMWHIFRQNQDMFRKAQTPADVLVYIEEAHNLLPAGTDMDLQDVWVRTAKEGAKY